MGCAFCTCAVCPSVHVPAFPTVPVEKPARCVRVDSDAHLQSKQSNDGKAMRVEKTKHTPPHQRKSCKRSRKKQNRSLVAKATHAPTPKAKPRRETRCTGEISSRQQQKSNLYLESHSSIKNNFNPGVIFETALLRGLIKDSGEPLLSGLLGHKPRFSWSSSRCSCRSGLPVAFASVQSSNAFARRAAMCAPVCVARCARLPFLLRLAFKSLPGVRACLFFALTPLLRADEFAFVYLAPPRGGRVVEGFSPKGPEYR